MLCIVILQFGIIYEIINLTNNTIYFGEIDKDCPYYEDNRIQEFSETEIKKCEYLRKLIISGDLQLVEASQAKIERTVRTLARRFRNKNIKVSGVQEMKEGKSTDKDVETCIKGHFYDATGYAKLNRSLAFGLIAQGADVRINPINMKNIDISPQEAATLNLMKRPPSRKSIFIDSIIPSFSECGVGKRNIINTTIESYSVPKQFIDSLSYYKEIWVTSDFCKNVLEEYTNRTIKMVPGAIDISHYTENGNRYSLRNKENTLKPFVFLSVFGWSYRKGYDVLLKSYLQEFTSDDPVSLLIVSRYQRSPKYGDYIKREIDNFIKASGNTKPPHIVRCSKVIPESMMPALYRACNAFVLFSRGEGFGYPYLEASLCGLPVIGTNCSGHSMFLNHDNSYLIDIDNLAPIPSGLMHIHYWDNQVFPQFLSKNSIEHAGFQMRYVFENYEKAKEKNNKLQNFAKNNYSIEKISKTVYSRLLEIAGD